MPSDPTSVTFDTAVGRIVDDALSMATRCNDAPACAERLAERADRQEADRVSVVMGARMRTAGMLDAEGDDLLALVAHGLVSLASLAVLELDRERAKVMSGAE